MAELNQKFHCKKNGVTEELSAYTTLDEVENKGLNIKLGGQQAYLGYDTADNAEASQLNLRKPSDSMVYRVLKTAKKAVPEIILRCFDVDSGNQLSAVKYPIPLGSKLYLNNANAPTVNGYDFVMMDGIENEVKTGEEVFDVWYVLQSVLNRNLTTWDESSTPMNAEPYILLNTYSMQSAYWIFHNMTNAMSIKRINCSNLTNASYMFYNASYLETVPELDTTKTTNMNGMFYYSGVSHIDWEIDMRSCTNCKNMFRSANIRKAVIFKNVPRKLDIHSNGLDGNLYHIKNRID